MTACAIQIIPLAPDVEYFLDAALEHNELDAASHVTLKLFAPRGDLIRIVDTKWELGPERLRGRLATCHVLTELADSILPQLEPERRNAIALAGAMHLTNEVRTTAWMLATWAFQDEFTGGCLKPWKADRHRRKYEMTKRERRYLHAPGWISRYVKHNDDARRMRTGHGRMAIARLAGVTIEQARASATIIMRDLQSQHDGYRRTNARALRQFVDRVATDEASGMLGDRRADKKRRLASKSQRNVIKRACVTATSILGPAAVSDFANGRAVRLVGETLALEVARLGSSAGMGHGAISVVAVHRDSRERLADLCVYHERTPALDQLTALALAMQSGEEADVIATANLSRVTGLGMQNPLIAERGRLKQEQRWMPGDDRAKANEAYWETTKPIWTERLGVFVLGRAWSMLERVRVA